MLGTCVLGVALLVAGTAELPEGASDPLRVGQGSPYAIDPLPHGLVTGGLLATLALYQGLVRPSLPGGLVCIDNGMKVRCNPSDLNRLDRRAVRNNSERWLRASDAIGGLAGVGVLVGLAYDAYRGDSHSPWSDFGTDLLVVAEATAVASGISQLLKFSFRRPRPTQYQENVSVETIEHQLSFPSGHATAVAAMSTAYAMTFSLRHPESPWRYGVWFAGALATVMTGYARVAGGFHFSTDIMAGVALGATTGFLIPYTARREASRKLRVMTTPSPGLLISTSF